MEENHLFIGYIEILAVALKPAEGGPTALVVAPFDFVIRRFGGPYISALTVYSWEKAATFHYKTLPVNLQLLKPHTVIQYLSFTPKRKNAAGKKPLLYTFSIDCW